MAIDLYGTLGSPPCRTVLMVAKALGVTVNFKEVNPTKKEQMAPDYIKLNPQHKVPTMVDNGFVLTESRAIICYLVDQYGKDDSLYPKDPKKRGVVNQRLYFDFGTLYQRLIDYYHPLWGNLTEANRVKLEEGVGFLEKFLESSKYTAGDNLTIADYSIATTIYVLEIFGFDFSKYPNITKWFKSVQKLGYEEINEEGSHSLKAFIAAIRKVKI